MSLHSSLVLSIAEKLESVWLSVWTNVFHTGNGFKQVQLIKESYNVNFWIFRFTHRWRVPMIKITDFYMLYKRENLQNQQYIQYLFSPLYGYFSSKNASLLFRRFLLTPWSCILLITVMMDGCAFLDLPKLNYYSLPLWSLE